MTFRSLTPGLTEQTCECCGRTEYDAVAHLLVEQAVLARMVRLEENAERNAEAWAEAEARIREAQ